MTYLYAKDNGEPLRDHTRKVLEGIRQIKKHISSNDPVLSEVFWKYLEWAAIIHDFGKASRNFQEYMKRLIDTEKREVKIALDELVPHSSLSPVLTNWFEWDMTDEWRQIILSAVFFHHDRSKLYNILSDGKIPEVSHEELDALKKEFENFDREYTDLITKELRRINYRFLNFLIDPYNVHIRDEFVEKSWQNHEQQKRYILFKGLLHRADHYASSLMIGDFDLADIEIAPLEITKVEENVLAGINKNKTDERKLQKEPLWQFDKLTGGIQAGQNIILIGSTGIGKTEFAFLWGAGRKMFFTLPMRTMADQVYKRARNIFGDRVGLLHSSSVAVLPQILKYKKENETADIESHINLARNLSYPVIISTGDQVLNVSLKYPTYEKIMATLGYSNLIIDEIQAYSPETSAVIVKTIEETTAVGGNFLLMTATLPEYIRTKIIERTKQTTCSELSIFSKQGEKDISRNKIHFVDNGNAIDGQSEKNLKSDPREFSNTVKNILKQYPGKRVLITINTVKNSQQLYSSIIDDQELLNSLSIDGENVMLLHSRFIGKHREEKVRRITECDESVKDLPVIKILITTQVIEASVDIDYDILISELAALDSLIQRMGRVNRNRGEYSQGKGDAYIINGFLSGAQYIYKWETMPLTSGLLKNLNGKTFSEKEKEKLIKEYYTHERYKKIIEKFEKNMHVLDNLLLASSKREAQKIFREINSVTVIPSEHIGDFEKEFLSVIGDEKNFRIKIRKLLLDYSTSIRFTDFINMHYVELGTRLSENEKFEKFKQKLKLKNFFRGYYVIPDKSQWEYNEGSGLMKKDSKEGKKSEPTGRIL